VEFVLDQNSGKFYFLEMNTRIQVEHPVTEQISGVDLVKEQIKVAAGQSVSISQKEVRLQGHSIECRINAELAEADFRPSPGMITQWMPPEGNGIRIDTHCFEGYSVPPFYDSLLAKVIASGNDRSEAIEYMRFALESFSVCGVDTTIPFLSKIIDHADFVNGNINTRWIEDVIFA
jgi:acetyl-CoA carboxylase biotin carboxylase subunit